MNKSYDKSIDLYSLGVLSYFLLSGTLPFDGKSEEEIRK
jgi:serine/threonine protein kinase